MQFALFDEQAADTAVAPEQGPSVAVNVGQVSIVPLNDEHA